MTYPTRQQERSGLGHLAMTRGPSEVKETAVLAGGNRITVFLCSQL